MMSPTERSRRRLATEAPTAPEVPERDTRLIWAGLFFAVAIFAQFPAADLFFSARYFEPGLGFVHAKDPAVQWLYLWTPWLGRALIVAIALHAALARPLSTLLRHFGRGAWADWVAGAGRRSAILMVCASLLGPGLVIEGVFKHTVGRPRPVQVHEFGGGSTYQGPMAIGSEPGSHKSFCSSHAATGFALMGLGLGCGPVWRRRWLLIGTVAGAIVGLGRIMQGGHFLSDIIFAFYAVWLSCEWVAWMDQRRTMRLAQQARTPPRTPPRA